MTKFSQVFEVPPGFEPGNGGFADLWSASRVQELLAQTAERERQRVALVDTNCQAMEWRWRDLPDRFKSKFSIDERTGCWVWARTSTGGYGGYYFNGRPARAHRVAYMLLVGPIPADRPHLDHLCRVRACVNPAHLEPVTAYQNAQRASWSRTRAVKP